MRVGTSFCAFLCSWHLAQCLADGTFLINCFIHLNCTARASYWIYKATSKFGFYFVLSLSDIMVFSFMPLSPPHLLIFYIFLCISIGEEGCRVLWSKEQLEDPEILALLLSSQMPKWSHWTSQSLQFWESSKSLRWSVLLHLWLHLSYLSFYVKPVYVTHCDNDLKHLPAEDGSLEVLLFGEENTFLES